MKTECQEENSRLLADLEYLETLISTLTSEELLGTSTNMYSLSIRNIGKIKGAPDILLKDRYVNVVNTLLKYLPEVKNEPLAKLREEQHRKNLPNRVTIDASTVCQLRCKACSFQKYNYQFLGRGFLSFENFKALIDNNEYIKKIELSNYGEIFLNPEIFKIIRYAYEKKVRLYADNGVNFNTVTDDVLEALVKYKYRRISISLDGSSQETYKIYRINGNFDTVICNIRKLNEYKLKYNSPFPNLVWQFVIMEHNENDVIKAKLMAEELGMKMFFKLTWEKGYKPKNEEMLKKETGLEYLSREMVFTGSGMPYRNYAQCEQLWRKPIINWDGRLLGCCCNPREDFGVNVFEVGLAEALNSPKYKYAKQMLLGKVGIPEDTKNIPCVNCKYYKTMCDTGTFLVYEE